MGFGFSQIRSSKLLTFLKSFHQLLGCFSNKVSMGPLIEEYWLEMISEPLKSISELFHPHVLGFLQPLLMILIIPQVVLKIFLKQAGTRKHYLTPSQIQW